MSVPRDLRDVLYSGITVDGVPLTEEMIAALLKRAEELMKATQDGDETEHKKEKE